jgi:hypothetical protein
VLVAKVKIADGDAFCDTDVNKFAFWNSFSSHKYSDSGVPYKFLSGCRDKIFKDSEVANINS